MGLPIHRISTTEFLDWEAGQTERHEYWRGETFAMVGGLRRHNRVVLNISSHLHFHLAGTPCQVFSETMKLQVGSDTILYPDVLVTCDPQFSGNEPVLTDPVLVIEVLSPSTQRYDRSEKFAVYRRLASLREYVLVDPETRRVEVFQPQADGRWVFADMTERASLRLDSVDFDLPLEQVFQGMQSDAAAT